MYKNPRLSDFEKQVQWERHMEREDGSSYYRSFVQYPLNAGLPRILHDIDSRIRHENRLYILFHRSPHGEDLRSPISAISVFLEAKDEAVDMGHAQLAWSCSVDGQNYQSATGFTGESHNQGLHLSVMGYGATPLLIDWADGRLEPPWVVQARSENSWNEDRLTGVMIPISEEACKKLLSKVHRFHKGDFGKNFRLADSLAFPGGSQATKEQPTRDGFNCLGFVAWALEDLDTGIKDVLEAASHQFAIPVKLLGWPKGLDEGHSISGDVRDALSRHGRWNQEVGLTELISWKWPRRKQESPDPDSHVVIGFSDPGKAQTLLEQWPVLFGDTPWMRQLPRFPD